MADREKVIKGLKMCISPDECSLDDCPYYNRPNNESGLCWDRLMSDALKLLKEQEPRVITQEELKQFEGSPCWFESSGTYMGKDGFWIIPAMFPTSSIGIIMYYTSVLDKVGKYGELGLSAYNKTWRCWTAKPTIEQRAEMKWDG